MQRFSCPLRRFDKVTESISRQSIGGDFSIVKIGNIGTVIDDERAERKVLRSKPHHIVRARKLRQKMSLPEVLIWERLRPKVNQEFRLRRQTPLLGRYTVDFYFAKGKRRIVFEIDGQIHELHVAEDGARDEAFRSAGIEVVRISARRVLANPDGVANLIRMICLGEIEIQDLE